MHRRFNYAKRFGLCGLMSLALGCTGNIADQAGGDGPLSGVPAAGAGGAPVVQDPTLAPLTPHPVPKLLRVSNEEYRNIVSDVLGVTLEPALFERWTPIAQVYGFDTMSEQRIDALALAEQLETSERITQLALEASPLAAQCPAPITAAAPAVGTELTWDNCGLPFVTQLASRAFRRPARAEEITGYQELFQASQAEAAAALMPHPFYEGLTTVVQSVLLSPNLMFKPELVPDGLDPTEHDYGVASKLALFFRSSVPDEELVSLAQSGSLGDAQVIRQQAERLLEVYRDRFTRNYGGQWLDFREPLHEADALMLSMQQEVSDVFDTVLASGAPPQGLMAPGFTVVDQSLAAFYGLAFDPNGPAVQQIPSDVRGGVLSHGFFLVRTATGSDFRRAIHRGLWTLTRLLCRALPRIDAATFEEISQSFSKIDRSLPLPQQMEIHRNSAARCNGCHGEMDPIGLGLEKYGPDGLWRETYEDGTPIVSDLELFGVTVSDPMQLAAAIEASPEHRTCVANKALTYAMNRGPLEEELVVAEQLASPLDGSQPSLKDVVIGAFMKSLELTEVAQ